jgi:predicted permease
VLVLSHGCWQRRFAGDPDIAGKTVKINGLDYTILGVAPAGFNGTELIINPDVWVPMSMEAQIEPGHDWFEKRGWHNIWVLGRLKPGLSTQQAEASLNGIAAQIAREHPETDEGMKIQLSPPGLLGNAMRGPVINFSAVLMGIAGIVLLLACVNLAGMLLARASDRRREIAVRLAIGARRGQLLRQLLTESLLLAIAGGAAAFLLTLWLTDLFKSRALPLDIPINTTLIADTRVLLFSFFAALVATLLFGFAPALQATRPDLLAALKNEAVTERLRRWHLRDFLVAAQVTLCVVLLISSVLVVRSLQGALGTNLGFNPERAVSISFDLSMQGYSAQRARAFRDRVLENVSALPGIESAGLSDFMPLRVGMNGSVVSVAGKPLPPVSKMKQAVIYRISPGYLKAAGTRLRAGRDFDAHDRPGSPPVALVNETFTRQLFAGENAIGKRFRMGVAENNPVIEIVGIVEDGKYESLGEEPTPAVFQPLAQESDAWTTVVARTSLPPDEAIRSLRGTLAAMDPALTLFNVGSLQDQLGFALFPARIAAVVLGAFGLIAVMLASTGVFALMAYAVSRRTREIGIRVALGARAGQVLYLVLRRTLTLLTAGVVLGTAIALAAGPLLGALLYGVGPRDPVTYVLALSLMAMVALLACWYPAHRAMRVDPAAALRNE